MNCACSKKKRIENAKNSDGNVRVGPRFVCLILHSKIIMRERAHTDIY